MRLRYSDFPSDPEESPRSVHSDDSMDDFDFGKFYCYPRNTGNEIYGIPFKFKWELEHLHQICKNPGDSVKSPEFPADGTSNQPWHLLFYPRGESEDRKYFTLFVWVNVRMVDVTVKVKIFNDIGSAADENPIADFNFSMQFWGYYKCNSRKSLSDTGSILINDKLTIVCEVEYTKPEQLALTQMQYDLFGLVPPQVDEQIS